MTKVESFEIQFQIVCMKSSYKTGATKNLLLRNNSCNCESSKDQDRLCYSKLYWHYFVMIQSYSIEVLLLVDIEPGVCFRSVQTDKKSRRSFTVPAYLKQNNN